MLRLALVSSRTCTTRWSSIEILATFIPMVTRQMATPPATLSAAEGEPRISPVPSSVRDALADPHWRRAMEEEYAALIAN